MTKQKNTPFDNVSRLKKIVVVTGTFASLYGGMFSAIVAINNFKYKSLYINREKAVKAVQLKEYNILGERRSYDRNKK